jgi:hypothetical protein
MSTNIIVYISASNRLLPNEDIGGGRQHQLHVATAVVGFQEQLRTESGARGSCEGWSRVPSRD